MCDNVICRCAYVYVCTSVRAYIFFLIFHFKICVEFELNQQVLFYKRKILGVRDGPEYMSKVVNTLYYFNEAIYVTLDH